MNAGKFGGRETEEKNLSRKKDKCKSTVKLNDLTANAGRGCGCGGGRDGQGPSHRYGNDLASLHFSYGVSLDRQTPSKCVQLRKTRQDGCKISLAPLPLQCWGSLNSFGQKHPSSRFYSGPSPAEHENSPPRQTATADLC